MIRLLLLGPQDVLGADGQPIEAVRAQPKRFGLLAYLSVEGARGPRRRDELLALFWPESDAARARRALTYALYFLRRELGEGLFVRDGGPDVALDPARIWTDVSAFEEAVDAGRHEEALALYRGDFLEGFYDADAPELEQWADARRLRLRERARTAAWALIETAKRNPAPTSPAVVGQWARRALELAPDDERALRELITALHRGGDATGMLAEYEHFVRRYQELHGGAPSQQTSALFEKLRATPIAVSQPQLSAIPRPVAEPSSTTIAPRGRRTTWRGLVIATGALLTGAIGIALAFARTPSADPSSASVVAIFPFAYHGAPELGYTSDGVATLLATGLNRLGGLRAVNPRLLLGAARPAATQVTPEDAAAAARRFGAGTIVLGDITEAGKRLRITATIYSDKGRVVDGPLEAVGVADSLFELVDGLTGRLAAGRATDTIANASSWAAKGTRSIPALRAFVDGERNFRTGQYDAAIIAYRQAIAADSGFALAYLRMSQAANWTGDYRLQKMSDDEVQRLSDRLSDRDRRRAEAWHLSMGFGPQRPESLYRVLVKEDPTDVEAWYYLADLVFHQGPPFGWPAAESRPAWERVLSLEPNDASALLHLARITAADGDTVMFDSLSKRVARLSPSDDIAFEMQALHAFAFGTTADRNKVTAAAAQRPMKFPVAQELAGHLTAASSDAGTDALWRAIDANVPSYETHGLFALQRASVAIAQGRLAAARALIDTAYRETPSMALRYRMLAGTMPFLPSPPSAASLESFGRVRASIARGDTIARREEADAWREFSLGIMAVRQRNIPEATRAAAALDKVTAPAAWIAPQLAMLLHAEVLSAGGHPADALALLGPRSAMGEWLGDPSSGLSSAHMRWVRAELLTQAGRDVEALRVLASIPDVVGSDIAYAPAAHLRRGELLTKLGHRAEAAREYARALAYWRNADAELRPLVLRAQSGLAQATGSAK